MKILYGIPSEGMGHATRSKVLIQHLIELGHEVCIATSDRALTFMETHFPGQTFAIEGLHLSYELGTVDKSKTAKEWLKVLPKQMRTNFKQFYKLHQNFEPDAVISDFESFTYTFAKLHQIPILSIDNMQVLNRAELDLELSQEQKVSFLLAKSIVKSKLPYCHQYLISSFFDCEITKKKTQLIPAILRPEILTAKKKTTNGRHILVYQTANTQDDLIATLQQLKTHQFRVYGFNKDEVHDNVTLKSFSEAGFIQDLASCAFVITNGGFSLISEAVYLHKPVCSFPLGGQFEQFLNGTMIQKLGYGRIFESFSADAIKAFIYDVKDFKSNVMSYSQNGNDVLFAKVNEFLAEYQSTEKEHKEKPEEVEIED
jgi:uncharacterized protein (TIGR00661 family)